MDSRFRIGNAYISATNPEKAKEYITSKCLNGDGGYICVSNMRTVVYANKHEDYLHIMRDATMCLPDGVPLVWMARLWGIKEVCCTNGPDLFVTMLNNQLSGIRHFLLGDTDETLNKIMKCFPKSAIVGTYSPPFVPLKEYDLQKMADIIKESGAQLVWLSLRSPKQDYLAAEMSQLCKNILFIGVGAAFRFAIGEYKHPSMFMQKMGLTGFYLRKIGFIEVGLYLKYFFYLLYWSSAIVLNRIIRK